MRYVLEGSVRESSGRVRISAWLEDTTNGYRMWSQTYEREIGDTMVIEREIATAITAALGTTLVDSRRAEGPRRATPSVSPEAHELYLKGRYFWNRSTPADNKTAVKFFQQAIDKAPDYAPPYAALAISYITLVNRHSANVREFLPSIRTAAVRSVELDPLLGEARIAVGFVHIIDRQWPVAAQEFGRAVELSPSNSMVRRWYAIYLERVGRLDEALKQQRTAIELDPVSLIDANHLGHVLYVMGRYDEAVTAYRKTLELEPNFGLAHSGLGMTLVAQKDYREGLREIQRAYELLGDVETASQLGYAYALSGQHAEAERILNDLSRSAAWDNVPASSRAGIYLGLGRLDEAFDWLSRAIDDGETPSLSVNPIFAPLRSQPRFKQLLTRMNLS